MSDDTSRPDSGGRILESQNRGSPRHSSTGTDSLDLTFDLLSDARRRYLLYHFSTLDTTVTDLSAAANAVASYEARDTDTDDHAPVEDIRTELHHTHLPRLADAGVIDYDHRHRTIRMRESPTLEGWVEHAQYQELD